MARAFPSVGRAAPEREPVLGLGAVNRWRPRRAGEEAGTRVGAGRGGRWQSIGLGRRAAPAQEPGSGPGAVNRWQPRRAVGKLG
jgi:hypothetical protein